MQKKVAMIWNLVGQRWSSRLGATLTLHHRVDANKTSSFPSNTDRRMHTLARCLALGVLPALHGLQVARTITRSAAWMASNLIWSLSRVEHNWAARYLNMDTLRGEWAGSCNATEEAFQDGR
jgi:hypothetical protein